MNATGNIHNSAENGRSARISNNCNLNFSGDIFRVDDNISSNITTHRDVTNIINNNNADSHTMADDDNQNNITGINMIQSSGRINCNITDGDNRDIFCNSTYCVRDNNENDICNINGEMDTISRPRSPTDTLNGDDNSLNDDIYRHPFGPSPPRPDNFTN